MSGSQRKGGMELDELSDRDCLVYTSDYIINPGE